MSTDANASTIDSKPVDGAKDKHIDGEKDAQGEDEKGKKADDAKDGDEKKSEPA